MRRISLVASFLLLLDLSSAAAHETQRRFEVRDSVEVANFTDTGSLSPDGKWIAAVTQRGILPRGVTEATLWLFDVGAVKHAIRNGRSSEPVTPVVLARLSAVINGDSGEDRGEVISRPAWASDSERFLFLGRDGQENRQLFRVDLSERKTTALTPTTQDVIDYSVGKDSIAYFAGPDVIAEKFWWSNDPAAPDIVVGTGQSLGDLLYPGSRLNNRYTPTEFEVWLVRGSQAVPLMDSATNRPMRLLGSYGEGTISLSPDGKRLAVIAHAERVPPTWQRYDIPRQPDGEPFKPDPEPENVEVPLARRQGDYTRARQYQLIDLEAGTHRPLIAAPIADDLRGGVDRLRVAWARDGSQVAITGTFPPLNDSANASTRPCAAAVVRIEGSQFDCLIDHDDPKAGDVSEIRWAGANLLHVQFDGEREVRFRRRGTRWQSEVAPGSSSSSFEVTVEQDLNHPPVLVATDRGKPLTLLDPNPQLARIALGNVSVYSWKTPRGQDVHGGLAKPPDFSAGRRYPLVIQTRGFPRGQFFNTGTGWNTAAAGRALAGRGMLVLQVGEPRTESFGTWREPTERGTETYLAAIDQLVREGLVDPQKVGIAGYSRSGTFVTKAITEAPNRFAAAVIANTASSTVFAYDTFLDDRSHKVMRDFAEVQAGALPYGEGLKLWLERAAGYHTDRIRAPVLVSAGDPIISLHCGVFTRPCVIKASR